MQTPSHSWETYEFFVNTFLKQYSEKTWWGCCSQCDGKSHATQHLRKGFNLNFINTAHQKFLHVTVTPQKI